MRWKNSVPLIILFVSILFSCTEGIPLDTKTSGKIVVNCLLTTDSIQELTLTYSNSLDRGIYNTNVDSAIVTLYNEDKQIGQFLKTSSRIWELNFTPVLGDSYSLQITIPGENIITASTTMPLSSEISFVSKSGYVRSFKQKKQFFNQWIFCLNIVEDSAFFRNPLDTPKISSSDKLIEQIATDHFNTDRFNQEGTLSDLIGDAASLPAYEYYIRVFNNTTEVMFSIEAPFYPCYFVVFRNSSYDYDQYMKTSLQKMFLYCDEDDPVQWFDENEVYSNISNGVGIFGAYTDQVFPFSPFEIEK